jgi:hypothetical protein
MDRNDGFQSRFRHGREQKYPCPYGDRSPVVQPVAIHFTDWTYVLILSGDRKMVTGVVQKILRLKYTKLQFYLFCMGVKLGLSH